ncbi:thermonuclease family protein [Saliniramus sp.]|uniref:thermonuclease family protein n=1 Tax=Saliniramus sp. TaxID=2986772 RepID=UPI002D117F35|nr:thermonuclease family protein [Saliniramus sp.]HMB11022.1 thermonuclease family protein [Saliniramus sp.]
MASLIIIALIGALAFWDEAPWQGENGPSTVEPVVITDGRSGGTLAPRLTGLVRVVDGDTISLGEHRIRLHGIDAPESDQACLDPQGAPWPCGDAATERLAALIGDDPVHCSERDIDRYQRIIGECFTDSTNLNATLVAEGLAFAYRRFSLDYAGLEDEAREAGRGIWAGTVQAPWDHRRNPQHMLIPDVGATGSTSAAQDAGSGLQPPGDCAIKGNINRHGERIYHTPDSSSYSRTRIDESRGQRWFCTEEEARAAGWRAPRG